MPSITLWNNFTVSSPLSLFLLFIWGYKQGRQQQRQKTKIRFDLIAWMGENNRAARGARAARTLV